MTSYETNPVNFRQTNRRTAINNLQDTHVLLERLMNKVYRQQDVTASSALRQIRTRVTALLSDMENKGLDTFNGREGTLDEFYDSEERFIESSTRLLKAVENAIEPDEPVDTYSLESSIDALENNFNKRIILTKEHIHEYDKRITESRKELQVSELDIKTRDDEFEVEVEPDTYFEKEIDDFDTIILPKLYNFINMLEQKYSRYQPEVSNNGDYLGNRKWKVERFDHGIRGTVKDSVFKTPLVLETYWHPMDNVQDAVQFVQSQANAVGKNQYKSLCLINNVWGNEIKEWVKSFVHQRMVIFLYELENEMLTYNETTEPADIFEFWHSTEMHRLTFEKEINMFIDEVEYFTVSDVAEKFGLNDLGAELFLGDLQKKGLIIDVGLGSIKYTKVKRDL